MEWQEFKVGGTVGWQKGDAPRLALVLHGGPGLDDYTAGLGDEVLAGGDGQLRAARYQQRGAPPSTVEGPVTVERLVHDAIEVLDHLDAPSALLVGHSWGSHLAMHIAVARPDRVAGLLLIDSLAGVGDGGTGTMEPVITSRITAEARAAVAALADEEGIDEDERGTRWLRLMWPGYFKDPTNAPEMPPMRTHGAAGAAMGDAMRLLGEGALESALPTIDIPSLHLIGAHSPIEPEANKRTAALMQRSAVEVLDTGHFPWLEQPGSVEAATRRLLEQMSSPAGG